MAMDSYSSNNDNKESKGSNMKTGSNMGGLFGLLGQANLFSSAHNIVEVNDIIKSLEDTVEHMRKNTASESQKLALPQEVQSITTDISPQLPGIAISTTVGSSCYVMPILFFKTGVTEVTESIFLANEAAPRGIAKVASSFMTAELMEKVKSVYTFRQSKQMDRVIIVSPMVVNLEAFIKNAVKHEEVITDVRASILKEWNTGLYNMVCLDVGKEGIKFPNPFKDGKMFGKDDSAVARIEAVNKLSIDGRPVPYNLSVKLSTTNKNNTQNLNSNNTRSVCTSYMNVTLDVMSAPQFQRARAMNPGQTVGPLVPVISTGLTIPGETLNNNNSMLTALLGLYGSIGANQPQFFSEAFRGKEVGHRGNISNFNGVLASVLPGIFNQQDYITNKNLNNAATVNNWLSRFVAPNAVYVMDLNAFSTDVSNTDFWWSIIAKQNNGASTYHRTLVMLLDSLTDGKFSTVINENASKGPARDRKKDWVLGDPILHATPIIMPTGIAEDKNGQWFDLAEVDGMFLRQENYFGINEPAVNEYLGLVCGQSGGEDKVRQFNIYTRLNQLFSSKVIVDGWSRRFIWDAPFFNTLARAMGAASTLSMSSSVMGAAWAMQNTNDYLSYTMTAVLNNQNSVGSMGSMGTYTHY